jgi:hypothetical protein
MSPESNRVGATNRIIECSLEGLGTPVTYASGISRVGVHVAASNPVVVGSSDRGSVTIGLL